MMQPAPQLLKGSISTFQKANQKMWQCAPQNSITLNRTRQYTPIPIIGQHMKYWETTLRLSEISIKD
jgi:hypothetical protein